MKLTPETIGEHVALFAKRKYGNQKAASKAWGVAQSYLSAIVHGYRNPTRPMLADMGMVLAYVPLPLPSIGHYEARPLFDREESA